MTRTKEENNQEESNNKASESKVQENNIEKDNDVDIPLVEVIQNCLGL